MKKLLTFCLMLLGAVAQAQNFAITATTEAAVRKNIVKGNAANFGFGVINDTLKLIGLTTRNVIFTSQINKGAIGLGNVDNTSDLNKPVSTATQTQLNLKANIASPTFSGTVSGITKSMVGLGSVDNTTDVGKPISTATQTALDLKLTSTTAASTYLPIANPTATGTLTAPTIANSLGANFATTSGNVGIGTTAPSAKLEIYGAGAIAQKITSSDNVAQIITSGTLGQIYNVTGDFYLTNVSSTAQIRLQTNGTDRLNIFSNGRVGINTTTDAGYLLDVNGTLRTVNDAHFATTSGNVGIGTIAPQKKLDVADIIRSTANFGGYELIPSTGTCYGFRLNNDNNLYLYSSTDKFVANATTRLLIDNSGNVGIGTTAPTSKLQVVGLPVYETNAAAVTGGLTTGAFYRTSVGVVMVVL